MKCPLLSKNLFRCAAAGVFVLSAFLGGCSRGAGKSAGITALLPSFYNNPLRGKTVPGVLDAMKEWTGTDILFEFVASDHYDDKMADVLSNPSEMPMIMHVSSVSRDIIDAAERGLFWDLNEFIWDAKKYPNLSQSNKSVCKNLTVNNKLIGLYKARDIGRMGLGYRTDWAEKFGLDEPKTTDDVYRMLSLFTYGDPDGNGINDTFGLALCKHTGTLDIIQTWFGCGNGWVEENGALVPVHQTSAYKRALDWMRKIYGEGLVPPDWYLRDTAGWQDQVVNGELGVWVDTMDGSRRIWDAFVNGKIPSVTNPAEYASMTLVGAVENHTLATAGYNGLLVITKAARTKKQVEACLRYLDKMCDPEMVLLTSYGVRGVNHIVDEEGFIVDTDVYAPEERNAYGSLNQIQCFIPSVDLSRTTPAVRMTPHKLIESDVVRRNEQYAVFNPAAPYLINSQTYSKKGAELDIILSTARTDYICGWIDEDGLNGEFRRWSEQGGDAVIAEVNSRFVSGR